MMGVEQPKLHGALKGTVSIRQSVDSRYRLTKFGLPKGMISHPR